MMRLEAWAAVVALLLGLFVAAPNAEAHSADTPALIVLGYGDIVDTAEELRATSVTVASFAEHLSWLRAHGYTPIRLQDVLAAREGRRALPSRAVLLTFEGGYRSFTTRVLPLLRAFRFPAVLGVPTARIDAPEDARIDTRDGARPRADFMRWAEIGAAAGSGLVELASQGHALDAHIPAAPGGIALPAATTRYYDDATGRYETDETYRTRLTTDLARSRERLEAMTGGAPRAILWPDGATNGIAADIAAALGMRTGFGGPPQTCTVDENLCGRARVTRDLPLSALVETLRGRTPIAPVRVVQVSIDHIADEDPVQVERNIAALVARIERLGVNTVYLQAFVDTQAKGLAEALYFPARRLPMRADLFGRVAAVLKRDTGVSVYAWLPVLSFAAEDVGLKVQSRHDDASLPAPHPAFPARLSPFVPEARQIILDIYEDLAKVAAFDGIMFHDDAILSDFEDANPTALAAKQSLGLPGDIAALRAPGETAQRWSEAKTEALITLTREIETRVERERGPVRTARNIFPLPIIEPASRSWFAQDFERFLSAYDETVVLAMPHLAEARRKSRWMRELIERVKATPNAPAKTVFMLQSVDWQPQTVPLPGRELRDQMRLLLKNGMVNFGYCPEDFIRGLPDAAMVAGPLSLETFPLRALGAER
jgi:biofilm PGA synthesis lipoprotein PgaB